MKILKYIFCITTALPLFGSGGPADISLGQFQTLKKKIINRTITPADARKQFQQLIGAIAPQDKPKYANIIAEITSESQKRGIQITGSETPPGVRPAKPIEKPIPATEPTKPEKPKVEVPVPTKPKQPLTVPVGGSKKPLPMPDTKTKPSEPIEKGKVSVAEQPLPRERLPEAQFNTLKTKLKQLNKKHKELSPEEITQQVAEIKNGFGSIPLPLYMGKTLARIELFKAQLIKDLTTINKLGTKLVDVELPALRNKLTDPKTIKNLILQAHEIEALIAPFEITYIHNKTVQDAIITATVQTLVQSVYTLLQESMLQAAKLKDYATLNKLMHAYATVAQAYPVYSAKRQEKLKRQALSELEKQEQEKKETAIQTQITEIIKRLDTNDYYTVIEPEKVDEQLIVVEDNYDLLTDAQKQMHEHIENYQQYVQEELDAMKILDSDLQEIQKAVAQKEIDLAALNALAKKRDLLATQWQEKLEESAKLHQNSWLTRTLGNMVRVIEELDKPIQKKEAAAFDSIITQAKQFMAQNPTDIDDVHRELNKIDRIDTYYRTLLKEAKTTNNTQSIQRLEDRLAVLKPLIQSLDLHEQELEKKLEEQERKAGRDSDLEDIIAEFERKNPGITSGHKPLDLEDVGFKGEVQFPRSINLVTTTLKEGKLPESPALSKIKAEETTSIQEFLKQRMEAREREIEQEKEEQKLRQERAENIRKEDL